jgi:hypothetical protein
VSGARVPWRATALESPGPARIRLARELRDTLAHTQFFPQPLASPPRASLARQTRTPAWLAYRTRGRACSASLKTFGVIGAVTDPAALAGYFLGDVTATGTITAPVKHAVVPFPDGSRRLLHCMESPEHWFEDFGAARLKNGRATVKLDADFAKVIRRGGYHVFLTPKGDCGGLYVRRQGGASFEVRELQGGRSSVAFCYRIVGRRKDIKAHKRFAKIDEPPMPPAQRTGRRGSSLEAMLAKLHKQSGGNPAHRRKRA